MGFGVVRLDLTVANLGDNVAALRRGDGGAGSGQDGDECVTHVDCWGLFWVVVVVGIIKHVSDQELLGG
jgi:hypothetical protein